MHTIIKRIGILGLVASPVLSSAMALYDAPIPGDHIVHDAFYTASLLNQRTAYANLSSTTQMIAPTAILHGNLQLMITDTNFCPRGIIGAYVFFPWITGFFDLKFTEYVYSRAAEYISRTTQERFLESFAVILGNFSRFPLYFQVGVYPLPWSRQTSEIFSAQSLFTGKIFNHDRILYGGTLGLDYNFNKQHNIKVAFSSDAVSLVGNVQYQLNCVNQGLIAGGGIYSGSERVSGGYNVYLNAHSHALKLKIEKTHITLKNTDPYTRLSSAFHMEISYHFSSYYFRNPSALVVGYENGDIVSTHWNINDFYSARVFSGFTIKCFKHLNLVLGGQWDIPKAAPSPLVMLSLSL
jgi:hypothetical protein